MDDEHKGVVNGDPTPYPIDPEPDDPNYPWR